MLLPKFSSFDGPSLAWSLDETRFYLRGFESNSLVRVAIEPDMTLKIGSLESTNGVTLLPCFGRVGRAGGWYALNVTILHNSFGRVSVFLRDERSRWEIDHLVGVLEYAQLHHVGDDLEGS